MRSSSLDPLVIDLLAQPGDHRVRDFDAADIHPGIGEWDGYASGADRELHSASARGEPLEDTHRGAEHLAGKHALAGSVVALRHFVVPKLLLIGHRNWPPDEK